MKKQVLFILITLFLSIAHSEWNIVNGQMHNTVNKNDVRKIKTLAEKDPSLVNKLDKDGQSPLYLAANSNKPDMVKLLLELGARINVRNKDGKTALHGASFWGHIECMKILINNGANVNVHCYSGFSFDFPTPLWEAIIGMQPEAISLLADNGADLNAMSKNGSLPLSAALAKNDDKLFKALIDGGADIYKEDGRGYSSYYSAINSSNEEIVRISKSLKSPK